jgi:hypothetical protein
MKTQSATPRLAPAPAAHIEGMAQPLDDAGRRWYLETIHPPDPCRAAVARPHWPHNDSRDEDRRTGLIAEAAAALPRLALSDLQRLVLFVEVLENHKGFTTPAEELIANILLDYEHNDLTPESAHEAIKTFTENYQAVIAIAKNFIGRNPDAFGIPKSWSA